MINAFLSAFIGAGQRCPIYSPTSSPGTGYRKEAGDCAPHLDYHVMRERRTERSGAKGNFRRRLMDSLLAHSSSYLMPYCHLPLSPCCKPHKILIWWHLPLIRGVAGNAQQFTMISGPYLKSFEQHHCHISNSQTLPCPDNQLSCVGRFRVVHLHESRYTLSVAQGCQERLHLTWQ